MSRADLDNIQVQLKVAIQSHQFLVSKMKSDPQNTSLQRQLHEMQAKITSLSDRQKMIVQLLRKELVSKQGNSQNIAPTDLSPGRVRSPANVMQSIPTNLSMKSSPHILIAAATNNNISKPFTTTSSVSIAAAAKLVTVAPIVRGGSPLIRVPQFSANKSSVQQSVNASQPTMPVVSTTHQNSKPSTPTSIPAESKVLTVNNKQSTMENVRDSSTDKRHTFTTLTHEEKKKLQFMAALDLITPDTLKEIQSRRSERKRRSTANPQFSYGHSEPERKKRVVNYLATMTPPQGPRKRGRPPKQSLKRVSSPHVLPNIHNPIMAHPVTSMLMANHVPLQYVAVTPMERDAHEDFCAICYKRGELLMCDTCSLVYHLGCLEPPLTGVPQGLWSCPKCVALGKVANGTANISNYALVHSYITHKANKEEEKRKLTKRSQELKSAKGELENKAKQLTNTITKQVQKKTDLLKAQNSAQDSVVQLKNFINVFQS